MKKLKSFFALLAFTFLLVATGFGQSTYQSAIGARLGYPLSLSIKHFVNDNSAVEAYVGTRIWSTYRSLSISGAYLYHQPIEIDGVEGLQWYAGGGGTLYFWDYDFDNEFASTSIGVQGYLGLDYKFEDLPLNLTVDWIPTIFFNANSLNLSTFGGAYGNIGIRYVFSE